MKKAAFIARCDLEVGDAVRCSVLPPNLYIIHDIITVHSFRTGEVDFIFRLRDSRGLIGVDVYRDQLDPL